MNDKMTQATNSIVQVAVERILSVIHPFKVILFGSYARGDERSDSDLDFAILNIKNICNCFICTGSPVSANAF